jgi:hypothetical protein
MGKKIRPDTGWPVFCNRCGARQATEKYDGDDLCGSCAAVTRAEDGQ